MIISVSVFEIGQALDVRIAAVDMDTLRIHLHHADPGVFNHGGGKRDGHRKAGRGATGKRSARGRRGRR